MTEKDAAGQKINLDSLPPQQLVQLKNSLEEEVNSLSSSVNAFKVGQSKYEEIKNSIENLSDPTNKGQETMIPLTSSLYIQGVVDDNETFLLDYGTDYFVERNSKEAIEFCSRKIEFLKSNMEKVNQILGQKSNIHQQIVLHLQKKMQLAATEQQVKK